jgi:hypothetical protein
MNAAAILASFDSAVKLQESRFFAEQMRATTAETRATAAEVAMKHDASHVAASRLESGALRLQLQVAEDHIASLSSALKSALSEADEKAAICRKQSALIESLTLP